eukprot:TRINITY_DN2099_c0_g1_i2.p1 TRINITY_DN2099_c0_g1~~TRINITY_DN2099_c0_g1_i2.p1  ORF type:complete len:212 (-),score=26.43 TRINITY_DN2099_c0_g1_i2:91-726(-)
MEHIDRIRETDYTPTLDDVIRARQITTGAYVTNFSSQEADWEIIDAGGQKPERMKWRKIAETSPIHAIIYFIALDEYNTPSPENESITKLQLSLNVFEDIVNDEIFHDVCKIVFLNKVDAFSSKLESKRHWNSFQETYPEYQDKRKVSTCVKYIKNLVLDRVDTSGMSDEEANMSIYTHVTCALDTDLITSVWNVVKEHIIFSRLRACKMI